jgi:tight adherence protein E
MLKYWKLFFRQKKASVSVEFAIVFPLLVVLFLFVLEFSRIMFIGSALDLVTTEITRKAAISQQSSYQQQMQQLIASESLLFPYIADPQKFTVTVKYCETVKQVTDGGCQAALADNTQILLFELQYKYSAIFSKLFSRILDTSLTKKTIAYREFNKNS